MSAPDLDISEVVLTPIVPVGPVEAAAGLRAAGPAGRDFLGLDPVTQNDALLVLELTRLQAQVFRTGETLLGWTPNPQQPRQATVSTTGTDPAALRAFLTFLTTYQRCTSFVATVPSDSMAAPALTACGFVQVGTLVAHRFRGGRFHDVAVFHAAAPHPADG